MEKIMEELLKGLKEIRDEVDWENEKQLISDGLLDSIDLVAIIPQLESVFEIEIGMEYMDEENFESVETMWNMINEIQG